MKDAGQHDAGSPKVHMLAVVVFFLFNILFQGAVSGVVRHTDAGSDITLWHQDSLSHSQRLTPPPTVLPGAALMFSQWCCHTTVSHDAAQMRFTAEFEMKLFVVSHYEDFYKHT